MEKLLSVIPGGQLGWPVLTAAVLVLAVTFRGTAPPAAATPSTATLLAASSHAVAATSASRCSISGDLVGDANPAQVYARMCGASQQTLPVTN